MLPPRNSLRIQTYTMPFPIRHRRRVVGVGVAVVAEVRAGVVLADDLRHDAAAGEALAGALRTLHEPVGLILLLESLCQASYAVPRYRWTKRDSPPTEVSR